MLTVLYCYMFITGGSKFKVGWGGGGGGVRGAAAELLVLYKSGGGCNIKPEKMAP